MINSRHSISIFLLALLPTYSFAFMCPGNFNQVDFGNTIADVTEKCGKPDKEVKSVIEPNTPQEWNYYIPQTVEVSSTQQTQGTLKATFAFDKDGKAINLSVNGIGVGASNICGKNINLGDSQESVKEACGKPAFINKQPPEPGSTAKEKQVVVYTYNGTPPVNFTFEDGIFVSKE